VENFCFSTEKIRRELGFEARWSVKEGVKQTVQYAMSVL